MIRKLSALGGALAMALLIATPSFADDRDHTSNGGNGKVILVLGSAQYTAATCTTTSGHPGNVVTGTARAPDGLNGTFSACVGQGTIYDGECRHEYFDVTLTDKDRSSVSASGVGTQCFDPSNPPFYGAFHINSGTGRFARATGLPGGLAVQVLGPPTGTFNYAATVTTP